MGGVDHGLLSCDRRALSYIGIRTSAKRYSCIGDAYTCGAAHGRTAGTASLFEGRQRFHSGSCIRRGNLRILSNIGFRVMGDEGLRGTSCHAGSSASAKASRRCGGAARIFRGHGKTGSSHNRVCPDMGVYFLIHHFHCRGQAYPCIAAYGARSCAGTKLCGILSSDCDRACISKLGLACTVFLIFTANISLRICIDIVGSRRTGSGKFAASRYGCRYGREIFCGIGLDGDRLCPGKGGAAADARVGMAVIDLGIHRRADAGAAGYGKSPGHAEEMGLRLSLDGDIPFPGGILARAEERVRLLVDHIHRDRAGAGKFRRAACRADGDGLGGRVFVVFLGRSIVKIFRGDGKTCGVHGICLRRVALHIGVHIGFVHHDGDRRAGSVVAHRGRTDADGSVGEILRRDSEISCLDGFAAVHIGLCLRGDRVAAGGECPCKSVCRAAGSDDGRNLARIGCFCRNLSGAVLLFTGDTGIFHMGVRCAIDKVHRDGCSHRRALAAAGKGDRAGIGINVRTVFRAHLHRFISMHRAVLHIGCIGIVDPVQADLPCHGVALAHTCPRGSDIEDASLVLRFHRERLIDFLPIFLFFLIDGEMERHAVYIGLITCGNGIVHEASCDGVALLRIGACRYCSGYGIDLAVIEGMDTKSVGGNGRRRRSALFLGRIGFRTIYDTVHRYIGRRGEAVLRLFCVVRHAGILIRYLADGLVHIVFIEEPIPIGVIGDLIGEFSQTETFFHSLFRIIVVIIRRMEAGASCHIVHVRLLAVIGHRAGDGSSNDFTRIFRLYLHIARNGCDGAVDVGIGDSFDRIVCHRRADACALGDAHGAGQVEIDRRVFRGDNHIILFCRYIRLSDIGIGGVIETVHADGSVDGQGFSHAAGSGHGQIPCLCLCVHIDRAGGNLCAAVNVRMGIIVLVHRERHTADGIGRFVAADPVRIRRHALPEIDRRFFQGILDIAAEIDGGNIGERVHRDLSACVDDGQGGLLVVFLANIGFRVIPIVHDRNGCSSTDILTAAGRLGPAVHQIGGNRHIVDAIEDGIHENFRRARPCELGLPGDLRLRLHSDVAFGLHVAAHESFRCIVLRHVGYGSGDACLLPFHLLFRAALICQLLLVGTHPGKRPGERIGGDVERLGAGSFITHPFPVGFLCENAAYFPCDRRFRIVLAEEECCRRVDSKFVPRLGRIIHPVRVRRFFAHFPIAFRLEGFCRRFLDLSKNRAANVFRFVHSRFQGRVAAHAGGLARIRFVNAGIGLGQSILRRYGHVAAGIDGTCHVGRSIRISNGHRPRQADHIGVAAVGDRRLEGTHRLGGEIHIAAAGDGGSCPDLGGNVAGELRPGHIRRRADNAVQEAQFNEGHLHPVVPDCGDLRISIGVKIAVVYGHFGRNVADTHIDAESDHPAGDGLDSGPRFRIDGQIAVRHRIILRPGTAFGASHRIKGRIVNIHDRIRADLRRRNDAAQIGSHILQKAESSAFISGILDVRLGFRFGLCIFFANIARRGGVGFDVNIVTGDGIVLIPRFSHVDLGICAVADIPGIELGLCGRMDGHIPRVMALISASVNGGAADVHTGDAHHVTDGGDLDISAVFHGASRIDIGIFDRNHAVRGHILRICLEIRIRRRGGEQDFPAAGSDPRFPDRRAFLGRRAFHVQIVLCVKFYTASAGGNAPFHGEIFVRPQFNVTPAGGNCALHGKCTAGKEDDTAPRIDSLRRLCHAGEIHNTASVIISSPRILRRRKRDPVRNGRAASHGDIVQRPYCRAVSGMDLSLDIYTPFICTKYFCPFRSAQIVKCGNAQKQLLPGIGIGAERKSSHIDDAGRTDSDAFRREEVHVAADFIVLQGIHHALDVDFLIDNINLPVCRAHVKIGNVFLSNAE